MNEAAAMLAGVAAHCALFAFVLWITRERGDQ
jgi:hypothetical protein